MARREFPGRSAPPSDPDWLTLGQAAKYLGVAQSTIRKWSDQGLLPAFYTPGGHRRFKRHDLDPILPPSGVRGELVRHACEVRPDPHSAPTSAARPLDEL